LGPSQPGFDCINEDIVNVVYVPAINIHNALQPDTTDHSQLTSGYVKLSKVFSLQCQANLGVNVPYAQACYFLLCTAKLEILVHRFTFSLMRPRMLVALEM
jgi:hypothetical protein